MPTLSCDDPVIANDPRLTTKGLEKEYKKYKQKLEEKKKILSKELDTSPPKKNKR